MTETFRLAWGIIGTGSIARTFAQNLPASRTGNLVAAASRTQKAADVFAKQFPCRAHGSYESLLNDPEVQAVYISTPHPMHLEWTIKAARAGKHILCEKPIGMNHAEATVAAEAARQNGVFLMEAFMYRCHPQTARVAEIIRSGRLGQLRLIEAIFAFDCGSFKPESRLFRNDLGGGAILDIGCYCTSMARFIAGAAQGNAYAEPIQLKAVGHLGQSGVDEQAQALLTFPGGLQARLVTALRLDLGGSVTVIGSDATLRIPSPWFCGHPASKLEIVTKDKVEVIEVASPVPLYSLEADTVADNLAAGEAPCMPIEDTVGNMMALDRWRQEIGLTYEMEKGNAPRSAWLQLRKPSAGPIPNLYATVPGLDPKKQVSRMVIGSMLEGAGIPYPHAFALYDYFYEHGGTTFDTAHIYGGGLGERTLGDWIKRRGLREKAVLIVKGAHTPWCDPANFKLQLDESLDRLQTDYADIYMLHRDNPAIPAGEFIEAMNEQVRAGRIRIFGGSNWTLPRIQEANAYAKAKALQGFGAVSNQFSLARMVQPIWSGCVSSSDPEFRAWHRETGVPLFAWSSQARGFFVRGARDFTADPGLAHGWYSDDNFERLARVQQLAHKKKTEPVHIAAAYVLLQPFPVFALIGPRRLSELASSFQAFDVTLSPGELAWLNLE
jgi:predicted dehydrogenase/aryl-alcohol dehydrogenase-like predicted oxidoreductase